MLFRALARIDCEAVGERTTRVSHNSLLLGRRRPCVMRLRGLLRNLPALSASNRYEVYVQRDQRLKTAVPLTFLVIVAASCFSNYETENTIIDEQPSASGAEGDRGPFGVERAQLYLNTPTGSGYEVEVTLPIGDGAHHTPVIIVQGGRVAKERYRWIAEHLSTRGFTVLNAQHPLDLAIMDIGASLRALEGVKAEPFFADRIADVPGVDMRTALAARLLRRSGTTPARTLSSTLSCSPHTRMRRTHSNPTRMAAASRFRSRGQKTATQVRKGSSTVADRSLTPRTFMW